LNYHPSKVKADKENEFRTALESTIPSHELVATILEEIHSSISLIYPSPEFDFLEDFVRDPRCFFPKPKYPQLQNITLGTASEDLKKGWIDSQELCELNRLRLIDGKSQSNRSEDPLMYNRKPILDISVRSGSI